MRKLIACFNLLWLTAFMGAAPQRIVSINLCSDESLLALADPPRVAGVTRYPKSPGTEKLLAEHPEIRRVSGRLEEVLALHPDLVIAGIFSPRASVEALRRLNIPVYLEGVPESFDSIRAQILKLAGAVGEPQRGQTLVQELDEGLARLPAASLPSKTVVFFGPAGHVTGSETFEDAVIRAAGGRNAAAEHGLKGHAWISLETLLAWNPQVLVYSEGEQTQDSIGRQILHHPALHRGLPQTRFVKLDPGLTECGSQATPRAVLQIAEALA